MNLYALIPFITVIAYIGLIAISMNRHMNQLRRIFLVYLIVSLIWSFNDFILHANYFPGASLQWYRAAIIFGFAVGPVYYHFIRAFFNKSSGFGTYLAYIYLAALAIFIVSGGVIKTAYVSNGILYSTFDITIYIFSLITVVFYALSIYSLIKGLPNTQNPTDKNRISYLIAAASIIIVVIAANFIPSLAVYSIDHIGNLLNTFIISYAILKYQLLNIKFVARRILAYLVLIVPLATIYIGALILLENYFPGHISYIWLIVVTILAIVFSFIARSAWQYIPDTIDRIFYHGIFDQRQKLLNISNKLGSVINLNQLAESVLPDLCKVLQVNHAQLLLKDVSAGTYSGQFAYPESGDSYKPLVLHPDNAIIGWLEKHNHPLDIKQISQLLEFNGLEQKEARQVIDSSLSMLSPIKSHGELIGIFAIGSKKQNMLFSQEDMEMTMMVAGQIGIIIENAQHYSQALLKANTDGLTQLYNHRHFHERLEQEISRSSRFGTVFSLILLDIDLFKVYNDNYGHLAGDDVLRRIGDYIRSSVRNIDLAARYGGEEFAIILPETRLIDAYNVAERIRKTIETKTTQRTLPVTVSLGAASWPVDGVMKEELMSRADKALYHAKKSGRNRTCLSTEITETATAKPDSDNGVNPKALSIIYALAATVDAKDHYTYGHSRKVSEYAVAIAEAINLPPDKISLIRAAGLLHDIGKIGVPDSILNKKEPLTHEEWEPIKAHSQLGVDILRHILDLGICLPAIQYHHEHYDGSGYPAGLKGKNIPLESRILAVADSYEAMTSPRAYRKQLTPGEAIDELKRCAGIQFDPEIVDVFERVILETPSWRQA